MANSGTSAVSDTCDSTGLRKWLSPVRYITSWFTASTIDADLPCTATEVQTCQILHYLPLWNEILYCIHYELRECSKRNGQLSLVSLGLGPRYRPTVEDFMDWKKANWLLFSLLKNHRCIDSMELFYWEVCENVCSLNDHVLCDALKENKSVKTLKVYFSRSYGHEKLCEVIASNVHLEHFECFFDLPAALPSALTNLLRTTRSLTVLKIAPLELAEEEAREFLAALCENATLNELAIGESLNAPVSTINRSEFYDFLKRSTNIKRLFIKPMSGMANRCECWWLWSLKGIAESRNINEVILENLVIGQKTASVIAKIFQENTDIQTVSMTSAKRPERYRLPTINTLWLDHFIRNTTIEKMTLHFHMLSIKEWKLLLRSTARKQHFRKVIVKVVPFDHRWLPEMFRLVGEYGAEENVVIESGSYFVGDSQNSFECEAFSQVHGHRNLCTKVELGRALQKIPLLRHITHLLLNIPAIDLDDTLGCYLSQCIKETTSLRNLHLTTTLGDGTNVPICPWSNVVSSLGENRSIQEIFMAPVYIQDEDVERLADAVRCSTLLLCAEFVGESSHKIGIYFRRLSMNVAENYTLLRVNFMASVKRTSPSFKAWYTVWEVARRNCDLLELAALFVSGIRCDLPCACALERVARHPSLQEKVASLASVSEAQAAAMIRQTIARLQPMDVFMSVSGVVKERVVCLPREDGSLQLDDLSYYCWSAVRRYLCFGDIKAHPEPPQEVEHVDAHHRGWRRHAK